MGFVKAGYNIVWSNDFDKYAVETYKANFTHPVILGDINQVDLDSLPDFDILIGGFPCQPFSMMGEKKGFEDARGTLFFRIAEIIKDRIGKGKKPNAIILENVRSLKTHDNGRTFATIKRILEEDLDYIVFDDILNSADYGIPQTRNRTYIVCFANHSATFSFPEKQPLITTMKKLLETDVDEKYFLSEKILPTILSNGTGGYKAKSEIDLDVARPLCATMAKMHRACQDNYVTKNGKVRRLTPRECARLQGFEDSFVIPVSDSQAYKLLSHVLLKNYTIGIVVAIVIVKTMTGFIIHHNINGQ